MLIEFVRNELPKALVLDPVLRRRDPETPIPHIYGDASAPGGVRPCLWLPQKSELTRADVAHCKIVPWLAEWLFFYEMWHITGKWMGGGEHPHPKVHTN